MDGVRDVEGPEGSGGFAEVVHRCGYLVDDADGDLGDSIGVVVVRGAGRRVKESVLPPGFEVVGLEAAFVVAANFEDLGALDGDAVGVNLGLDFGGELSHNACSGGSDLVLGLEELNPHVSGVLVDEKREVLGPLYRRSKRALDVDAELAWSASCWCREVARVGGLANACGGAMWARGHSG